MKQFIVEATVTREITASSKQDAEDIMNDLLEEQVDQHTITNITEVEPTIINFRDDYKEGAD